MNRVIAPAPRSGQIVQCLKCRRPLTSNTSIQAGYGRRCLAIVREAALREAVAAFKPFQVTKALALIADGGLVATNRSGIYRAVSSDGTVTYLVHLNGCACPAGLHESLCYHRAGVALLEAHRRAA